MGVDLNFAVRPCSDGGARGDEFEYGIVENSTRMRGAQVGAARLRLEHQHETCQRHQRVESSTRGPLASDVRLIQCVR